MYRRLRKERDEKALEYDLAPEGPLKSALYAQITWLDAQIAMRMRGEARRRKGN